MSKKSSSNVTIKVVLFLMATLYNLKPSLKKYLKSAEGWMNFSVGIRTESGSIEQAIIFNNGKVRVSGKTPPDVSVSMVFVDDTAAKEMLSATPNEAMNMLLRSRMRMDGNLGYIQLFLFMVSQLTGKKNHEAQEKEKALDRELKTKGYTCPDPEMRNELSRRRKARLKGARVDHSVKYLDDPYLSRYDLDDFPRLKEFVDIHFTTKPALCHERPKLLTDWHTENGFEVDERGKPWVPELRQAYAYKYLMENRKPLIRKNDLIAGTTTTKDIGVVIYPDGAGNTIWGELLTVTNRVLQPYDVSPETVDILHHYVFPYWIKRNFREWVRHKYQNPLCQQLDDRFAVYFLWKTVAISHTIPDFPKILRLGT
ncbi:MAG: formate acetyltransferase, partial [Chloroflexi bacterium]|nr:formate acetyltransferase [Chloroflexota bacterium]